MNVIPQYKVIGPYNYDMIIHNIYKKINAWREDIGNCVYIDIVFIKSITSRYGVLLSK